MRVINKTTGKVIDFTVGRRTKENIKSVTDNLLSLNPKHIYTDRLNIYQGILSSTVHKVFTHCTNKIERSNLTLRTHVKRLVRKTICFTKNPYILHCTLKLYWYGN